MTLSICLVLLLGPLSLTESQSRAMIPELSAKLSEAGVKLRVRRIKVMQDPTGVSGLADRRQKFNRVMGLASILRRRLKECRPNAILLQTGPLIEGTTTYLHGYSSEVCARRKRGVIGGVSQASGVEHNQNGEPRLNQSVIAMTHESLHLCGAFDNSIPANVMNLGALEYVKEYGLSLPVLPLTVSQVRACMKGI